MGGEELGFIQHAFDANWVSPAGPHIDAFEKRLAEYNGVAHCAALSSGTAAIHLALVILGVKPGDEVICSTFTFSGSFSGWTIRQATLRPATVTKPFFNMFFSQPIHSINSWNIY